MLINFTNHKVESWSKEQLAAAKEKYGRVEYVKFPAIDPMCSEVEIKNLASEYLKSVMYLLNQSESDENDAVLVSGEMSFVYVFVNKLKEHGIKAVCTTTERNTIEIEDEKKIVAYKFVRFRSYF